MSTATAAAATAGTNPARNTRVELRSPETHATTEPRRASRRSTDANARARTGSASSASAHARSSSAAGAPADVAMGSAPRSSCRTAARPGERPVRTRAPITRAAAPTANTTRDQPSGRPGISGFLMTTGVLTPADQAWGPATTAATASASGGLAADEALMSTSTSSVCRWENRPRQSGRGWRPPRPAGRSSERSRSWCSPPSPARLPTVAGWPLSCRARRDRTPVRAAPAGGACVQSASRCQVTVRPARAPKRLR